MAPITTRKVHKIATLTFRVGDHIFSSCSLKNHMTFFWDFWSKLFGNILKIFLISCSKFFKLIFLNSPAKKKGMPFFYFVLIFPRFFSSHNFLKKNTVLEKSIEALFNQELRNSIWPKLAELVSRLDHRLKLILFISWKTIFFSMC